MPDRRDVAEWAALVRLQRATERYLRELAATMPAIASLARRHEQLGPVVDALVEATATPPEMGSVTYLGQVLSEVRLPPELFVVEP